MKLRRSLALAAATAALAPAVLLAAPSAYAEDDTTPVSEVPSSPAAETPASDAATTPAATVSASASASEPAPASSAAVTPSASAPVSASASASASASVSASPSPSGFPTECDDATDPKFDDSLRTGLSGLPSKVVAGSGFHGFRLNVDNTGDHAYQRVDLGVFAARSDDDETFATSYLTLQFKDPSSGRWTDISLDEEDKGAGYLGYTGVKAHESFSIDLRLAVDKKAPAGTGFAISVGMYADDAGNCVYSDDDSFYEFDILKAGTAPGTPGDAKPQGGSKPLPAKPAGDTRISPQGHLAETGAGSALPALALAGGAAVAFGAGTVFVVRRRRSGTTVA